MLAVDKRVPNLLLSTTPAGSGKGKRRLAWTFGTRLICIVQTLSVGDDARQRHVGEKAAESLMHQTFPLPRQSGPSDAAGNRSTLVREEATCLVNESSP